jgi:hypothetical protein
MGVRMRSPDTEPSGGAGDAPRHRVRQLRLARRVLGGVLAFTGLLAFLFFVVEPATWEWRRRRDSVRLLSSANTQDQLRKAVGHLGVFVQLVDGSWLAIRYVDTHGGRVQSLAVVRDSEGSWYQSREHFCGTFASYRHRREQAEQLRQELAQTEIDHQKRRLLEDISTDIAASTRRAPSAMLEEIFAAPSLQEARRQLANMGFEPMRR